MHRALRPIPLVVAVALLGPVAASRAVELARTGQQVVFDTNVPAADDGALQSGVAWPSPRFSSNGDGTVTDDLTGLVWLHDGSCFATQTWQGALDLVVELNAGFDFGCVGYTAGTHDDWRLPNIAEMASLVNAGATTQSGWLSSSGFTGVNGLVYFTSSTWANPSYAWGMNLLVGNPQTPLKSSHHEVWPVRAASTGVAAVPRTGQFQSFDANQPAADDGAIQAGVPWPSPRFYDLGDGSVVDRLTGLTWLADADCIAFNAPGFDTDGTLGDGQVSWQHALDFAVAVNAGDHPACSAGLADWRLPNWRELASLVDYGRHDPALPASHPFAHVASDEYWSSTTEPAVTATAWVVHLNDGGWAWRDKVSEPRRVWLVRGPGVFADGFESGDTTHWSAVAP